jgi:hypothetical protein
LFNLDFNYYSFYPESNFNIYYLFFPSTPAINVQPTAVESLPRISDTSFSFSDVLRNPPRQGGEYKWDTAQQCCGFKAFKAFLSALCLSSISISLAFLFLKKKFNNPPLNLLKNDPYIRKKKILNIFKKVA